MVTTSEAHTRTWEGCLCMWLFWCNAQHDWVWPRLCDSVEAEKASGVVSEWRWHLIWFERGDFREGDRYFRLWKDLSKVTKVWKNGLIGGKMSQGSVGAQHLCANHREDDLGATGGDRMQRLEGCALNIWTLSCEWRWPLKGSGVETDMHWRGEILINQEACAIFRGKLRDMEMKNSSILNTSTKPFLLLYPPSLLSFHLPPHSYISCTSFIFHLYFILLSQHMSAMQGDVTHQSLLVLL